MRCADQDKCNSGICKLLLVLIFLLMVAPSGCAALPEPSSFRAGMTKQNLIAQFGEPIRRQTLVKNMEPIWGPIEEIWFQLAMGTEVELWAYRVKGGTVELYFLNGSDVTQAGAFSPEGVVY